MDAERVSYRCTLRCQEILGHPSHSSSCCFSLWESKKRMLWPMDFTSAISFSSNANAITFTHSIFSRRTPGFGMAKHVISHAYLACTPWVTHVAHISSALWWYVLIENLCRRGTPWRTRSLHISQPRVVDRVPFRNLLLAPTSSLGHRTKEQLSSSLLSAWLAGKQRER